MKAASLVVSPRVKVYGRYGHYLFTTHASRAKQWLLEETAERMCSGRQVQAIKLTQSLENAERDRERPSSNSLMTTFRETHANKPIIQHKRWHPSLEPMFRQAQTDCMV